MAEMLITDSTMRTARVEDGRLKVTLPNGEVVDFGVVVGAAVTDADIAAQIADPASATAAQLNSAFVAGVSRNMVGNLGDLQAAVDEAESRGVVLYLSGTYIVDGPVVLASKSTIIGTGAGLTIAQSSPLTPVFTGTAVESVTVADVTVVGLGTDYVNNDTVYGASAFKFAGDNGRIHISNVSVEGIAGAGVFVGGGSTQRVIITNCDITGVGLGVLGASNYSAGVVIQDGVANVTVEGCEISQIAQGISVGHGCNHIKISGNRIHHTSEHGAYLAAADNYTVTGNHFYDTTLLGLKIQKGIAGFSCKNAVIADNIFERTGSTSILITNAIDAETFLENAVIADNIIADCGDTGVRVDRARRMKIAGNIIDGARFGIRVYTSTVVDLVENMVESTERTGVLIDNSSHVTLRGNTMMNLGLLGPEKVGIIVSGLVDSLTLDGNSIDYDTAAQSDGLLFAAGTYANLRIRGNYFRGANWGMRTAAAAAAVTVWRNNVAVGGVGTIDGVPTLIPTLPDTTGSALAAIETELNKVKAILRTQRDAR